MIGSRWPTFWVREIYSALTCQAFFLAIFWKNEKFFDIFRDVEMISMIVTNLLSIVCDFYKLQ